MSIALFEIGITTLKINSEVSIHDMQNIVHSRDGYLLRIECSLENCKLVFSQNGIGVMNFRMKTSLML